MQSDKNNEIKSLKIPASVNMDQMTAEQIHAKLAKGYEDVAEGRVQNAITVYDRFREKYS